MARIRCKKCSKKFSDSKDRCPRCNSMVVYQAKRNYWTMSVILLLAIASSAAIILSQGLNKQGPHKQMAESSSNQSHGVQHSANPVHIPAMKELLSSPDAIAQCDIAVMNLLCAKGLPGSECLDIRQCLRLLDQWAEHTKQETEKYLPAFYRDPSIGDNSESKYRILILAAVLVEDMKCDYNMQLVNSGIMDNMHSTAFFHDSRDVFIHGLLTHKRCGTCSSMPVLLTAMAQRLRYPVYLSTAKGHLIAIWDDGKGDRFNIGYAGKGITFDSDDFYRKWPKPISDEEYRSGLYLRSFSNNEALAIFLSIRAMSCLEHRRYDEATASAQYACALRPRDTWLPGLLVSIQMQQNQVIAQQKQATLVHAAEVLRANGQVDAAQLILQDHQPNGGVTQPGFPQQNMSYSQIPVQQPPCLPSYPHHGPQN